MSQALYRKWRPHLWEQVVGQEHIVHTLQNAIRTERVGHAYLFAGPRGTGKTTTARLLAKAVNCLDPDPAKRPCDHCEHCLAVNEGRFLDLIEIDAASNTSVDDVRDLRDKISFSPSQGKYKVYIIDEVHMLSTAAFNALLKTLEEPPAHAIFILATTEVHKIPATVLSRVQRHEFRRLPVADIVRQLQQMAAGEGLAVEPEALTMIARQATGSMRDAISLLDQLASTGEAITLATAQQVLGTATSQVVVALVEAILQRQSGAGLDAIHSALDSGTDARQFARQVVDYLRNLLLVKLNNAGQVDATAEMRAQMAHHAAAFTLPALLETLRLFNDAASEKGSSGWQPSLLLEMALAGAVNWEPEPVVLVTPGTTPPAAVTGVPPEWSPPAAASEEGRALARPSGPEPGTSVPETPRAEGKTPEAKGRAEPKTPARAAQPEAAKAAAEAPKTVPAGSGEVTSDSTSAGATPAVGLTQVQQQWPRVRAEVKKKRPQTVGLLNSCKPVAIKDGVLLLAFQGEVVKQKMEMPENLELTREVIRQVLGVDFPIRCIVMTNKTGQLPADLDVEGDGMVGTALNLGAEIVHKE